MAMNYFYGCIFYVILIGANNVICKSVYPHKHAYDEDDKPTTDIKGSYEYKHSELEREFLSKVFDFEEGPNENETLKAEQQEAFLIDVIAVFAMASLCLITLWVVVLYAYGYQCFGWGSSRRSTMKSETSQGSLEKRRHPRSTTPTYRSISSSNRSSWNYGKESPISQKHIITITRDDSASSLVAL